MDHRPSRRPKPVRPGREVLRPVVPLWAAQAAQVANDEGFAKIRKNSRFPVDKFSLNANLYLV